MKYPVFFFALFGSLLLGSPRMVSAAEDASFNIVWADVISVEVLPQGKSTAVQIALGPKKADELSAFTEANISKRVRFQINGHTTLRPIVQEKISGGTIQLQVSTLEEANQVISFFYEKKKHAVASPALDAFAEEIRKQETRLQDLVRQKETLRASGKNALDPDMQQLNREISLAQSLIKNISDRYRQERGILNR